MGTFKRAATNFVDTLFGRNRGFSSGLPQSKKYYTAEVLAAQGLVYAAIDKIAQSIIETEVVVTYQKTQTESVIADGSNWLVSLMQRPNIIGLNWNEIERIAVKQLQSNGNAFLYTPKEEQSQFPNQIYVLPAGKVQIVFDPIRGIAGYELSVSGQSVYFDRREVCHLRFIEPTDDYRTMLVGKGKIHAAIEELAIDKESKDYLRRYFENDATAPRFVEGTMNPEAWDNYRARWNQNLPNFKLSAMLDGIKFATPPESKLSLSYDSIVKESKSDYTSIMGVPLTLLRGEHNNRATAEVLRATFNEDTINPLRVYLSTTLTQHFSQFDSEIQLEYTPYRYNDEEAVRKQELHELGTGRKTINMFRQEKGLPATAAGDTVFIAKGSEFVPLVLAANPPAPVQSPSPQKMVRSVANSLEKKKIDDIVHRQMVWRKLDKGARLFDNEVQKIVEKVIATDLSKKVLSKVKKKSRAGVETELFDSEEWTKKLTDELRKVAYEYASSLGTMTLESLGEVAPDDFAELMKAAVEESTEKITSVTGTIKDEIKAAMQSDKYAEAGKLTSKIEEIFSRYKVGGSSASNIGETTSTATTGAAQSHTAKAVSAKKSWLSSRDAKVRDAHSKVDGQVADADGYFTVGGEKMQYPAGGSIAANNCRCRCYLFISK